MQEKLEECCEGTDPNPDPYNCADELDPTPGPDPEPTPDCDPNDDNPDPEDCVVIKTFT